MNEILKHDHNAVTLRAAWPSYALLCGMWLIPFCIGFIALLRTNDGLLVVAFSLCAAAMTAYWLARFLIILTSEQFTYRSLLGGCRTFDRSRISKAEVVTGYNSVLDVAKPFVRLEVEGSARNGVPVNASVNLRVFGREIATVIKALP